MIKHHALNLLTLKQVVTDLEHERYYFVIDPPLRESSAKRHPLGRIGKPLDISHLIVFLLSGKSTWMTGQVVGIDGSLGNLKAN